MKRLILLLCLSLSLACSGQVVKDIFPSEYRNYFLFEDGRVGCHYNDVMSFYPLPEKIATGSAGVHPAAVISESGQVYLLDFPSLTFKKISITDGGSAAAFWNTFVILSKDGSIKAFDKAGKVVSLKLPANTTFTKVAAGYVLQALASDGSVWQWDWKANASGGSSVQGTLSMTELAKVSPVKMALPGPATDITVSRSLFASAVVNGIAYVKAEPYGARYVGNFPNYTNPKWNLPPIVDVEASDNTLHLIDKDGKLYGLGDGAIGEIGDGQIDSRVKNSNNWDMAWQRLVIKPVLIGDTTRKYVKLRKGNSYVWRTWAQEDNGLWSSWGSNKGGLLANGIFPASDVGNIAISSVTVPRRVTIPNKLTRVPNDYFKSSAAYPPAEPKAPEQPKPEPPKPTVVKEITLQLMSDSSIRIKQ